MKRYLSKSDFKVARECPTKLYYKKLKYPSTKQDDPYLEFLADGGFMVEKIAQIQFPEGQELEFGLAETEAAAAATQKWVEQNETGVLFEAVVAWESFMARADILHKEGDTLRLIEVKSTSVDTSEGRPLRGKRGGIESRMRPYLEDITYQTVLMGKAFPGYQVEPSLCVVDKAQNVDANCVLGKFELRQSAEDRAFNRPEVLFHGDGEQLRQNHPLAFLNVQTEVAELRDDVWEAAERYARSLQPEEVNRMDSPLRPACGKCEYRYHLVDEYGLPGIQDGFHQCWGELASEREHLLDPYYCSSLGKKTQGHAQRLIDRGDVDLREIDTEICTGQIGKRQRIQIEYTAANREYIDPLLPADLNNHTYPLHFIDFEASRPAIPFHEGMRPYELVCFQWSCHTIREPGGPGEHSDWINKIPEFPNFSFARELMDKIGTTGTVYTWSPFESSSLKTIAEQLGKYDVDDSGLAKWLDQMEQAQGIRVIDLCKLALQYYFHPSMKGRVSIKYVLPAVLQQNPHLLERPEFQKYRQCPSRGETVNPYDTLPPVRLPGGTTVDAVREGTGAIRAYEEMLFGLSAGNSERKNAVRDLLLQYCELDTAAMVMIWDHWVQAR